MTLAEQHRRAVRAYCFAPVGKRTERLKELRRITVRALRKDIRVMRKAVAR